MKRIRWIFTTLAVAVSFGFVALPMTAVHAATPKSDVCNALGSGSACTSNPPNSVSIDKVITVAIDILSVIAGIAGVIMVLVGGFKYITSGGDANNVASAKRTLIYAIIGLVVAAMSQVLVELVLNKIK
jgi:choline-glycine betaine transporter